MGRGLNRAISANVFFAGRKWTDICSEVTRISLSECERLFLEVFCWQAGEEQLLLCLSMYLECAGCPEHKLFLLIVLELLSKARLFLKGKRHQRHLVANELAALICLQLKAAFLAGFLKALLFALAVPGGSNQFGGLPSRADSRCSLSGSTLHLGQSLSKMCLVVPCAPCRRALTGQPCQLMAPLHALSV